MTWGNQNWREVGIGATGSPLVVDSSKLGVEWATRSPGRAAEGFIPASVSTSPPARPPVIRCYEPLVGIVSSPLAGEPRSISSEGKVAKSTVQ